MPWMPWMELENVTAQQSNQKSKKKFNAKKPFVA